MEWDQVHETVKISRKNQRTGALEKCLVYEINRLKAYDVLPKHLDASLLQKKEIVVNDIAPISKSVELDSSPILYQNRTMVPIRSVAELMGFKVDWDHPNRKVVITTDEDVQDGVLRKTFDGSPLRKTDDLVVYSEIPRVNDTYTSGPVEIKILRMSKGFIKNKMNVRSLNETRDWIPYMEVQVAIKNKTNEEIYFQPEQSTLVTNTNEMVRANAILSNSVVGHFNSYTTRKGYIYFIFNDDVRNIDHVKITFPGAGDMQLTTFYEPIVAEYDM